MYFPAEQIRTDANKTTHKMVQFIKIKWIFTCHQVQMMEKVNVKFPSVNSLTNGRTMKGEVSVPVNEGSCQRNTHESRRYFMIAVEEEGVSFIFSPHSYSPDTHTHVLLQAGRQAAGDSQPPLGWEHLPPPPPPLPHPHWMVLFGFGSLSFTGQSSFHHPSTLSWKEALNISLQLLITCNELPCKCVCVSFFSPTVSLSLSLHLCGNWYCSYSCRIVQRDDGNAAVNAHPLPVWASSSHKAAVQPAGGGLYLFV